MTIHQFKPIPTPEGLLFPVWRDWDTWAPPGFVARFVYVTSLGPWQVKGPVVHTERTTILTSFGGRCRFSVRGPDKTILELDGMDKETLDPRVLVVQPNQGLKIENQSSSNDALILVVADVAWSPTHTDQIKFKSWEEYTTWAAVRQP